MSSQDSRNCRLGSTVTSVTWQYNKRPPYLYGYLSNQWNISPKRNYLLLHHVKWIVVHLRSHQFYLANSLDVGNMSAFSAFCERHGLPRNSNTHSLTGRIYIYKKRLLSFSFSQTCAILTIRLVRGRLETGQLQRSAYPVIVWGLGLAWIKMVVQVSGAVFFPSWV